MASGMTRLALAKLKLNGDKSGNQEMNEEMNILNSEAKSGSKPRKMGKIPMKYPSEHNESK